jgi:ankyrin repeat protein
MKLSFSRSILAGLILSTAFFPACSRGKPSRGDLFRAAARGDLSEVTSLIKRGADLNEDVGATPEQNLTPLLAAIARKHEDVAVLLIGAGARIHPTFEGYSAADFALYFDQKSVFQVLNSSNPRGSK